VTDTREQRQGRAIRRKRRCEDCGGTFTTLERYEQALVEKKSGEVQPFDREKLVQSIERAASGRPGVDANKIADRVTADVLTRNEPTPTRRIGASISEELAEIDPIAYIRWALVFVDISDLHGVKDLVANLQTGVRVKKRSNGKIERFDRVKLVESVQRAVTKEQYDEARSLGDSVADEVERVYSNGGLITSGEIAKMLTPRLKQFDEIACIRYETVHNEPADAAELVRHIEGKR
jgi:transcriptional repressor NrdR